MIEYTAKVLTAYYNESARFNLSIFTIYLKRGDQ